ncbi:hypothetical protein O181_112210 [Austropuccinia psidii MF-1]|uniref:Uncharacterized protein n=1 Tax=Austropuccinia psidii MF-1 TaxID=1389203 RepID=A0A9Q3PTA9_9BASI|nr:hypothetical protein [Austropuccinia psidii MF-1]
MDLPSSSYNDSLEELWDEEEEPEEIEPMMKVFPSDYHQYLDFFSKVKAEKPPHHHACDHHIELEGSLPPGGVINSLSNQGSDTLRAYFSENIENGFIQPSFSSSGAHFLFAKKRMVASICVLITTKSMLLLGRTNILFLLWTRFLMSLMVLLSSPRLICVVHINYSE